MVRVYSIDLVKDGEPIEVSLRLTLGSQIAMKKHYKENALSTIFGALDDPEKIAYVFQQALNFKGNDNVIKDGEELYDLIVENDMGGVSGFQKILSGIARESGILTEKERNVIDEQAEKVFDVEGNADAPQLSKT